MGMQTVRFGILAFLTAFGIVEGMRLVMIVTGAAGPRDEAWILLSGIQQVGWQLMLACYGVLLVGSALLRTSMRSGTIRRWATGAVVCLIGALASRGALIGGGLVILVRLTSSAEGWCLLGALLAVDMAILRLGEIQGNRSLSAAAAAHAVLVGALALAILIRQFSEPDEITGHGRTLESVLRFSLGTICFAWAFRLTSDATRVCGRKAPEPGNRATNRPSTHEAPD